MVKRDSVGSTPRNCGGQASGARIAERTDTSLVSGEGRQENDMKTTWLAMLTILAAPALAQDAEKVDPASMNWKPVEGYRSRFTREEGRKTVSRGETVATSTASIEGDETVTRIAEGRVTEVVFSCSEAAWTVDGKALDVPFRTRTVRINLLGEGRVRQGVWRYEMGGDMGDEVHLLGDSLRGFGPQCGAGDLLPKKLVSVGQTWTCPTAWFVEQHRQEKGALTLSPKSSAKGTLKRVFSRDGARFATFVFTADLVVTGIQGVKLDAPGRLREQIELEACVDGSRPDATLTCTAELNVDSTIAGDGRALTLRMEQSSKLTRTTLPRDERAYELDRRWTPVAGHRAEVHENLAQGLATRVWRGGKLMADDKTSTSKAFTAEQRLIRVADRKLAEWTWAFSAARHREAGGERVPYPFEGKEVRMTRIENGQLLYACTDGTALEETDGRALGGALPRGAWAVVKRYLPKKAVAVGATWTPDWREMDDADLDVAQCAGSLTLKYVEDRNGAKFARIDGEVTMPFAKFAGMSLKKHGLNRLRVEMTLCIDGTLPDGEVRCTTEGSVDSDLAVDDASPPHVKMQGVELKEWHIRTLR
jgi:hypothetical protein